MACVYVLSNPSFPHLYKIGYCECTPQERANQLHTTGLPTPFKVEREWIFDSLDNAREVEEYLHFHFKQRRHVNNREFFERIFPDIDTIISTRYKVSSSNIKTYDRSIKEHIKRREEKERKRKQDMAEIKKTIAIYHASNTDKKQ